MTTIEQPRTPLRAGAHRRAVWALSGFLIGVFLARVVTTVLHLRGAGGNGGLIIRGVHIHHAMFGLAILATVTTMWMLLAGVEANRTGRLRLWSAAFMGFAWALILDEFALLLHLKDVYWLPTGEESLYALFVMGVVLMLAVVSTRHQVGGPAQIEQPEPDERSRVQDAAVDTGRLESPRAGSVPVDI